MGQLSYKFVQNICVVLLLINFANGSQFDRSNADVEETKNECVFRNCELPQGSRTDIGTSDVENGNSSIYGFSEDLSTFNTNKIEHGENKTESSNPEDDLVSASEQIFTNQTSPLDVNSSTQSIPMNVEVSSNQELNIEDNLETTNAATVELQDSKENTIDIQPTSKHENSTFEVFKDIPQEILQMPAKVLSTEPHQLTNINLIDMETTSNDGFLTEANLESITETTVETEVTLNGDDSKLDNKTFQDETSKSIKSNQSDDYEVPQSLNDEQSNGDVLSIVDVNDLSDSYTKKLINKLEKNNVKLNENSKQNVKKRKSTLSFVFDATGSMYDDLVQLQKGAKLILKTILEREDNPIENFVLVPYRDPEIGPVTVTSSHDVFESELENMAIYGGGDCPESSLSGIAAALNASLPYSYIYVFTDATATDHHKVNQVINLVQEKQSQIVFVLTGDCKDRDSLNYKVYEQIAAASSGQIFHLEKSKVEQILSYIEDTLDSKRVNLNTIINPPGSHKHKLLVDNTLKKVTVSVAGREPNVSFTNPWGDVIKDPPRVQSIVDLSDVQVVNLINPDPGNWTINVGSIEQHSVRVTGLSNITFKHSFSVQDPHKIEETTKKPLNGTTNYLIISIENDADLENLLSAELVDAFGKSLFEMPLYRMDNFSNDSDLFFKSDPIMPPTDLFNVAINGLDKHGNVFRRSSTTGIKAQEPEKPKLHVPPEIYGEYHGEVVLTCKVESLVPIKVWWFRDGKPVLSKEFLQSTVVEFSISDLSENTEGSYICKASNIAGHSASTTNVILRGEPPKVNLYPKESMAVYNAVIRLTCYVESKFPVSIKFLFRERTDGDLSRQKILKEMPETYFGATTEYVHNVVLSEESEGIYTCVASNRAGSDQMESTVRVVPPLKVSVHPKILEFQGNTPLHFSCIVYGTMSVQLTMDSNDIKEKFEAENQQTSNWNITEVLLTKEKGVQVFYDLSQATKEDEGIYYCSGKREDEIAFDSIDIRYVEAPAIHMKHNNLLFELDTKAVIDCKATGIPQPLIQWFGVDGTQIISEDGAIKRVDVNSLNQLVVYNINPIDNGKYSCRAENQFGISNADVEITVYVKPYFTDIPEDQTIDIYTSKVLTCKADGIPPPKVSWYFNDMPYSEIELVADSGINLHLRNVETKHSGKYSCVAENKYDLIKEDVYVDIVGLEPPVVYKGKDKIILNQGDHFKFVCKYTHGKPYPKLYWLKNGHEIWSDLFGLSDNGSSGTDSSSLELSIDNMMVEQEGNYSCVGRNSVGEDRYEFTIEVNSPPKFADHNTNVGVASTYGNSNSAHNSMEVVVGDNIFLDCAAEGKPKPLLTWSKDGIPIIYTNITYINNTSLVVNNVRESDAGLYTCFVSNPAGTLDKNFTVEVLVPPSMLNESAAEAVTQTVEGQLVVLPCPAYGVPPPEIKWEYNDQPLPTSNRYQLDLDYTIRFVANLTDGGVYRCNVINKAGNTSKEYLVLVFVPPYTYPAGNEVIKTKANLDVLLQCNAIGFPVPAIRWIKNGQTLSSNASMNYILNDSGELKILNISKDSIGTYICEAENLVGLSEKLFQVVMNEAPNILPSEVPVNIKLLVGEEDFKIPCKAVGNPQPYITWLRDKKYIVNDYHIRVQVDGTLELKLITEDLNGVYTCQAANTEGSVEIDYHIQVIAPPTLVNSEEDVKISIVTEGSTATLNCPLKLSQVLPNIQWYRKSKLVNNGVENSKLTIINVTRDDSGEYTCLATNPGGQVSATLDLIVQWPPTFVSNLTDQDEYLYLLEGEPVELACHVDANPSADVQWLKNYEMIGDISPILKRKSMKTHHAGEHICIASNSLGQVKKKFMVHVSALPKIEGALNVSLEVRVGQSVTLECFANGHPKPQIEWVTKYPMDWNILGDGRIFKSYNISINSDGVHSCQATNTVGTIEKNFYVKVLEPPKPPVVFIHDTKMESSSISLQAKTNTTLSCVSSGQSSNNISWIRNNIILSSNEDDFMNKSVLKLNNVQMSDSGVYTCLVKNKIGFEEVDVVVDVLVPPEILNKMSGNIVVINNKTNQYWRQIEVVEQQSVELDCRCFGNPFPDIYWFKNTKYLGFYDSNVLTRDHGQVLVIHKVSRDHRGNFTCVARNKVGEDKLRFNLDVWVPPFIDQTKTGSQVITTEKGKNVTLECDVASNPPPMIRWLKSPYSEIISSDSRYTITEGNTTLVIKNVNVSDSGDYSCIGTNIIGMVEILFSVEVVEPPSLLEDLHNIKKPNVYANGTIVAKIRRSLQLACNAVGHPEPSIVWYKDGFLLHKTFAGDSFHISKDGRYLNIMDAQLSSAGNYSCNAFNKVGSIEKEFVVKILVPAEWGIWSTWSECSESCGLGVSTRKRECQFYGDLSNVGGFSLRILDHSSEQTDLKNARIAEEFLDKSSCRGNSTEFRECFNVPCKVDGGWSPWGEWTSCSVLCGAGSRRRYRTCSSPKPQHGGKPCVGADAQQEPCVGRNCSQWFAWSAWSMCSVTCGSGKKTRTRKCNGPTETCLGSHKEYITCKLPDCLGKWSDWGPWGPCSVTCGSGVRRRTCLGTNCTGGNLQIESCVDLSVSCNQIDYGSRKLQTSKEKPRLGPNSLGNEKPVKETYLPSATFVIAPEIKTKEADGTKFETIPSELNMIPPSDQNPQDLEIFSEGDNEFNQRQIKNEKKEDFNVDVFEAVSHSPEKLHPNGMHPFVVSKENICSEGYNFNHITNECVDVNECQYSLNKCHSTQLCENTPGSYRCLCQRGYRSLGNGQRCKDINECLQNIHECSHDCINMAGTYRCSCPVGLKLTTDNKTCVHDENLKEIISQYTPLKKTKLSITSSSQDENILITRISPKRNKPVRIIRPHKHTFDDDYEDYDFHTENSNRKSLSPVNSEENNAGVRKQRISKHTTAPVDSELPYEEDTDFYVPFESSKIKSNSTFNATFHKSSLAEQKKRFVYSEEDSYEDEESSLFEDICPDGFYQDHQTCIDIDECEMNMNVCNGVTDACINTIGSHMCVPTPCPEGYKRTSQRTCTQNCSERGSMCAKGALLTQSIKYIVISTSSQDTKIPGAILSLQEGEYSNGSMTYSLERQPKGETFYVSTSDKAGTVYTLMPPTFKRINRIIIGGKRYDETKEKLLHYIKFIIYLYIGND